MEDGRVFSLWIEDISCNARNEELKNFARAGGYFVNRRAIEADYMKADEVIGTAGYKNIGLITNIDAYEYPIQYMLKYDVERIEHVMVDNETGKYEDMTYIPDCILTTEDMGEAMEVHEEEYERVLAGEYLNVYEKANLN